MKFLRAFFLSLAIVLIVPSVTHAREIIKEQNGEKCIDLEAIYADINDSSKALTGDDNGIDAVKKAQIVSSLTNIMGILAGEGIYCINDEEAAIRAGSFKDMGLLGTISQANAQMMAFFPSGNVTQHLAEEFVPGYGGNNALFAQGEEPQDEGTKATLSDFLRDPAGWVKNKVNQNIENKVEETINKEVEDYQKMYDESEANQDEGDEMTMSGYTYLKDKVHLDSIWGFFRNIAYVFFIIIMIITGFMIMFRKELPGQVVVGISNTLPQIILGIILVTFSFAIVGLVMDVGKISMTVVSSIFQDAYDIPNDEIEGNVDEVIAVGGIGSLTNQALKTSKLEGLIVRFIDKIPLIGPTVADFMAGWGGTTTGMSIQSILLLYLNNVANTAKKEDFNLDSATPAVDLLLDPLVEIAELGIDITLLDVMNVTTMVLLVRNVIILLVCLYASFKVFITMWMTYLKLFVNVIFAPIQIMLGSLPGNFSMTTQWFKSVVANVLVFVGIHLVINLVAYLAAAVEPNAFNFFGNKGAFWPNWIISLEGVLLIAGYLFAANMPQIINGVLKIETSREFAAVGQSVKQSASKIPLVGGMFGS